MNTHQHPLTFDPAALDRRAFITLGLGVAAVSIMPRLSAQTSEPMPRSVQQTTNLARRKLGDLEVSALGAGCMNFVQAYSPRPSKADAVNVIRTAYEQGVTFFDVAQSYGPFTGEELVGEAVAPFRDKVIVATNLAMSSTPMGNGHGSTVTLITFVR